MLLPEDDPKALFLHLHATLKELDLKSIFLEHTAIGLDECDMQMQLGKRFIQALTRWASASPDKADTVDSKTEQDVRNIIVKHTSWIIIFVGICVLEGNSPMPLPEIECGIDLLLKKFRGMDKEFDERLQVIADSGEVELLRKAVACFRAENGE
ncbi:hypothetical protein Tcan_08325 [Toxocara canis]|uniref:Uncharacterized protein n=2 Tax=Toxocara canis TaxID=6265 RepID=A0A0B2VV82_TOXCA|nr:hypothetical protein Tcan_08325 [Toxocara canis]VDM45348.1 unnamed protein product [Toxocara canis]